MKNVFDKKLCWLQVYTVSIDKQKIYYQCITKYESLYMYFIFFFRKKIVFNVQNSVLRI